MITSARRVVVIAAAFVAGNAACGRSPGNAGIIGAENAGEVLPTGTTVGGRTGDFFLRNDLCTFIIQRPGRELALGPYGGTLIDAAMAGGSDHFGELIPVMALGRTVHVTEMRVLNDGSDGEPAQIEGVGVDATNVYYNLEGLEPSLLSYEPGGGGVLGIDPDANMNLRVKVLYTLPPDATRLNITYTFENAGEEIARIPFGLLVDSGGTVETFATGRGFSNNLSKSASAEEIAKLLEIADTTYQTVLFDEQLALSLVPVRVQDKSPPRVIGITVPALGAALILEADTALEGASEPAFTIRKGESAEIEIEVIAAATPAEALAKGWDLLDVELGDVSGCVTLVGGGPARDVRVGLNHAEMGTVAAFTTGPDGCFAGRAPRGDYTAVAGTLYRDPSAPVELTVPGTLELTLAPLGGIQLGVEIYDTLASTRPSEHPCRLTLMGEAQMVSHPGLGASPDDDPGGVVSRQVHLRRCNETVDVAPGRYLAFVTRGPEFNRIEQIVDVRAGAMTTLRGRLQRVIDSDGYAASDFHVHSLYSSDSSVAAQDRVITLAAEGMDFWASTEHDVVADYTPHIEEAGLSGELSTVPGAEVTTFDTGHFGAYPLDVDPDKANGGSPDWAAGLDGRRPLMQELFDGIHARGGLVQVNHPRGGGVTIGNYFTRGALTYDPSSLQPFGDHQAQPLANSYLRYPDGVEFFSADFDVIEVMNGISTYVDGGMVYERSVEREGHDWMNLLSSGRRILAVANSDTHSRSSPPGNPRTFVGGHERGVPGLVDALRRGNAVLTTGPMLRVTVSDDSGAVAGMGETLTPSGDQVTLHLYVETADWYRVDAFDVLANVFMPNEQLGQRAPTVYGPRPLVPTAVKRANGGWAWVASTEVTLDLSVPPFDGGDGWIVVRVGGTNSQLYPVMYGGGGVLDVNATTPEAFLSHREGERPFAMSNAIYIDGDRDGTWTGIRR